MKRKLEKCTDKPDKPQKPWNFRFSDIFNQVKKDDATKFDTDTSPAGSWNLGLPTSNGLVDKLASNRMTYMVANKDKSAAVSEDAHHVYGRLGQSPDIAPGKAVAFAPVVYKGTETSLGMMVSIFPETPTDTGLASSTDFVNF